LAPHVRDFPPISTPRGNLSNIGGATFGTQIAVRIVEPAEDPMCKMSTDVVAIRNFNAETTECYPSQMARVPSWIGFESGAGCRRVLYRDWRHQ
jgi:hypothetical protein